MMDSLSQIDQLIEAARRHLDGLLALRADMAGEPGPELEQEDDDEFVDSWTAAQRFNLPIDTVRWLARTKAMGVKERGKNRWLINVKALRRYLTRRSRPS
ncbi:hypothetical protein R1538_18420 [Rhizobium leguminosarum]|uniref:hypothetical protein n=1 Tax=Rhizobium leguminosarum TaxID=384 RepID=UPI00293DC61E|nr:hypothetical protein [Rhizobium leguminosarum]MDV4163100.1 hypothetical protein [Rhizobium leguminosarum]MDV4172617.1 hypothetical protein [Rhizobium leguminosarum]